MAPPVNPAKKPARPGSPSGRKTSSPSGRKTSSPSGRVTPTGRVTPKATGRYTPPVPKEQKVSPKWVPIVMFTSLALGMLVILTNYVNLLPGDGPSNLYLLLGLGLITMGFVTATRYH